MVGIICPPGWDRVTWILKTWWGPVLMSSYIPAALVYITYFPIKNFSPCRTSYTASSIERSGSCLAPSMQRAAWRGASGVDGLRRPPRLLHKRFSRPAASCLLCRCATLLFHPYRQGQWGSNEIFALYPAGKKYSKIFSFAFWHIQWPFFFGIHSKPINIKY